MGVTAAYAVLLAAVSRAAKDHPLTAVVVTAAILLLFGAILWSFLRRARRDGVLPLAVDRLDEDHRPEPADPARLPGEDRDDDGLDDRGTDPDDHRGGVRVEGGGEDRGGDRGGSVGGLPEGRDDA